MGTDEVPPYGDWGFIKGSHEFNKIM